MFELDKRIRNACNDYHYTNLDVLSLILRNRTLRFTRLDQVDDREESNFISNGVNLGPYTFVSCWSEVKEENIPMWKMYTKGKWGVRLSLVKEGLFKTYVDDVREHNGVKITKEEPVISLFPPEIRWRQKDFIPPIITEDYDTCNFYRKVKYVDDIKPYADGCVKITSRQDKVALDIHTSKVGSYKNKRWAFQEESRFVLFFMPGNILSIPYSEDYFSEHKRMIYDVINNKDLGFSHYDMSLSDSAFDHLVITLSPLCEPSLRIMVEALCEKYAPKAKIVESSLVGKLAR